MYSFKNKYQEWNIKYVGDAPKQMELIKNLQKTVNVRKIKGRLMNTRPKTNNREENK